MSTATPPPQPIGISYQPRPLPAGKPPFFQRINWRILVFISVILLPIALIFLWWLNEFLSGGVHDYGAYKEVDLKAMSTFDMDQTNATMKDIPEKWRNLEGKKVLMQGEMWAPNYAGDTAKVNYFQLVYSKTKCCFSGPPLAQHFVDGNVVTGKHAYYYDVPVKVLGTLHVFVRKDPTSGIVKSIYHVDVEKVTPIE
jgi:hypothetical protein